MDPRTQALKHCLQEIAAAAGSSGTLPGLIHAAAKAPATFLGYDCTAVLIADEERESLEVMATHGLPNSLALPHGLGVDMEAASASPSVRAYQTLEPVVAHPLDKQSANDPLLSHAEEYGVSSVLAAPILFDGSAVGTLDCMVRGSRRFSKEDVATVSLIAQQTALAFEMLRVREVDITQLRKLQAAHEALATRTESLRKSESIHERLRQLVLNGGRLTSIAEALADALSGQVLIVDSRFGPLAHSFTSNEIARRHAERLSENTRLTYLLDAAVSTKSSTMVHEEGEGASTPISMVPVFLMREHVASILALNVDLASGGFERPALENASTLVALEFLKERHRQDADAHARGNLVHYLLDGQIKDDQELWEVMAHDGYDFKHPHRSFVIRSVPSEPDSRYSVSGEHRRRLEKRIAWSLRQYGIRALSGIAQDQIALFVPAEAQAEAVITAIQGAHRSSGESSALECRVGIGSASRGVEGLRASYEEAARCATFAERLRSNRPIDIDRFGLFGLLITSSEPEQLVQFAHETLRPLRGHPVLIDFLREYFAVNGSIQELARNTHIHVNTAKYRLRRAGEFLGVDIREVNAMMEVRLALMIEDLHLLDPAHVPGDM